MKIPLAEKYNEAPELMLAWLLRDINQMTLSQLSQNLARYGLYVGQPRILRLIHDYPGSTQKQIADRLFVSGASLSTSIKRLQKAQLVEQRQSETDRRRRELYLTPAGERAKENCSRDLRQLHRSMLGDLDQNQVEELLTSLLKIHKKLKTMSDVATSDSEEEN
ncbi:MAG: MarR family winged helix-turn-helix transcriptional regulator [Eubacteriales bacterium]|nr:MarR family winged helix-turn-helix transcriptional regulator [Eubacteriales bacterium]MDD4324217.1 MarR family winged helix-turn-helix transcriptional regulator [Eubacteriales bacterium]